MASKEVPLAYGKWGHSWNIGFIVPRAEASPWLKDVRQPAAEGYLLSSSTYQPVIVRITILKEPIYLDDK